mmetsp:Transcript_25602/g.82644  ORF Transcript_25602/g.82644 Transcript_25602/m.82644 type:complete len:204 (-) Transcript_25602:785-1396(-)
MRGQHALGEVVVGLVGEPADLVEKVQHAGRLATLLERQQRDGARVVGPGDGAARDALGGVELLLGGEDVLVEGGLQLLVGKVDEQLLEAISGERFKPKDVKDPDKAVGRGGRGEAAKPGIHEADGPVEERRVDSLGQCVARVDRLLCTQPHGDRLDRAADRGGDAARGERLDERRVLEAEEPGGSVEPRRLVGNHRRAASLDR